VQPPALRLGQLDGPGDTDAQYESRLFERAEHGTTVARSKAIRDTMAPY